MTRPTSYQKKRDFSKTPEPPSGGREGKNPIFVVQRHDASHLHYDFRLEVDGTLKSWAVPKGFPKTTKDKRLAVMTEDHPLAYARFEGRIPEGEYGAGTVKITDHGTYENLKETKMATSLRQGHIEVHLLGEKYRGGYALIRMEGKKWLLIKMKKQK